MKAEERHELQQNDLASWVYTLPYLLKQYGSYVLLVAACCVLSYQLWNYYQTKQEIALQSAWNEVNDADSPSTINPPAKLRSVIEKFDVRPVQAEAYLQLGKFYHDSVLAGNPEAGYKGVKIKKDAALEQAEAAFKKVISEYTDLPLAAAQAYLQLGAVEESKGDWDAAKRDYQKLIDKAGPYAGTAFASEAQFRLDSLDKFSQPVVFAVAASQPATATAPAMRAPAATEPTTVPKLSIENP